MESANINTPKMVSIKELCERQGLKPVWAVPRAQKKVEVATRYVEITERLCSEKIQPNVKVGHTYIVQKIDRLKDGTLVLELVNFAKSKGKDKNVTFHCNAKRFKWRPSTQEALVEQEFRETVEGSTKAMMENLTIDEQMRISFVPLIITELAWTYAEKAMVCAARDKVEILKKLNRTLKELHKKYNSELRKDLDYSHAEKTIEQTKRCIEEIDRDLTVLYFSVNQEFKRTTPEYPCDELRTYAIISTLFVDLLEKWNREMDQFLAEKLSDHELSPSVVPPIVEQLRKGMVAFAGVEGKFNYSDKNVQLGMKVIENRIRNIQFSIF